MIHATAMPASEPNNPYASPSSAGASLDEARDKAFARLRVPSIALLVMGIGFTAFSVLGTTSQVLLLSIKAKSDVSSLQVGTLSLLTSSAVGFGAIQMRGLRSHRWAMIGAIAAIIPCSPFCVLSFPFGIWALVVLSDANVRRAFTPLG